MKTFDPILSTVLAASLFAASSLVQASPDSSRFEVASDGPVFGYFAGQSADYDNVLRIAREGISGVNGFHNHRSSLGDSINFGNGTSGSEVWFSDQVINTGDFWYSDKAQNSDGLNHLFYSSFSLPDGTPAVMIGFEDLKGLGDNDKNDVMAVFTNVQIMSPVPEPETYLMMLLGLWLIWFARRFKNNQQVDGFIAAS